jgi:hypothetical protein
MVVWDLCVFYDAFNVKDHIASSGRVKDELEMI